MNRLHLSENIIRLRREKGVTQEELARFIGVTKASISKWETGMSFPDILLLPQLAAYFGVTVDSLLGYEAGLSREQIRACYHELTLDFAKKPFPEVLKKVKGLVKQYYSCYPFLLQMSVLLVNHFMIPEEREMQQAVLCYTEQLCGRILENCKDLAVCSQAVSLKALADLQLGKPEQVVEALEELFDVSYYDKNGSLLTQAYLMQGEEQKADQKIQVKIYQNLLDILGEMTQLLHIHRECADYCTEILRRGDSLISCFQMEALHPNATAVYHYQAAQTLCLQEKEAEAWDRLEQFALLAKKLLLEEELLKGDRFFDRLDEWLEELDLGTQKVRDEKFIRENACQALRHPVFRKLSDQQRLARLREDFENATTTKRV